jgi:mono/diheme cytochrome c family protein
MSRPLRVQMLGGVVGLALAMATMACTPSSAPGSVVTQEPVDGARLFQRQCATCHGARGAGNGPSAPMSGAADLSDPAYQERTTDAEIAQVIREGRGLMPPWGHLNDAQVDALVAFVRTLADEP